MKSGEDAGRRSKTQEIKKSRKKTQPAKAPNPKTTKQSETQTTKTQVRTSKILIFSQTKKGKPRQCPHLSRIQIRVRTDFRAVLIPWSSPCSFCYDHARSKRSRFITLFHAATKSRRNFSWESSLA